MRTVHLTFGIDGRGIDKAIRGVEEYKRWLLDKTEQLTQRLAEIGVKTADVNFLAAYYDGVNDAKVTAEKVGDCQYVVKADGESVLFIEFGTGLIGYGHPDVQGYGPGTYPPKDPANPNWNKPGGWFYYGEDGEAHHTHGNPPNAPMYNTVKELEQQFEAIAQEVFAG